MNKIMTGFGSVLIGLCWLATTSCVAHTDTSSAALDDIGWFDGHCLAIKREGLEPGAELLLLDMNAAGKLVSAHILGAAASADTCNALLPDRADINKADGNRFYQFKSSTPVDSGVAVLASGRASLGKSDVLDIDQDGQADQVSSCNTSEGIQYSAWSGTPHKSRKLWSGYEYMGYDMQPSCPEESR